MSKLKWFEGNFCNEHRSKSVERKAIKKEQTNKSECSQKKYMQRAELGCEQNNTKVWNDEREQKTNNEKQSGRKTKTLN